MAHRGSALLLFACFALSGPAPGQNRPGTSQPRPAAGVDDKAAQPTAMSAPDAHTAAKAAANADFAAELPRTATLRRATAGDLARRFRPTLPPEAIFDGGQATIQAEGRGFKASFAAAGFTFLPFFGSAAPRNYPLTLRLQSASLGRVTPLAAAAPQHRGHTVTIDHGALRELYDVHLDRIEQKFEITTPFVGDLTLTLDVTTELHGERDAAGLRFGNALGHVHYTNAVLVDALGRRTTMETDFAPGRITLRAPAAAIADAAFPLTVDPVLTRFAVTSSSDQVLKADIAYSERSGHYLVAWVRIFSATDLDVHSVAIDGAGVPVPNSSALIDNSSDRWDDCRVASSGANFLVVAARVAASGGSSAIWGRTRAANSPAMGAQTPISGGEAGDKVNPDVGGELATASGFPNFCVVWQRNYSATDHDIHYQMVSEGGTPWGVLGTIDNAAANDDFRPRIAKSSGAAAPNQAWPVTWQRLVGGQYDIYGAAVIWHGALAVAPFAIDTTTDDDTQPAPTSLADVGGGKHFLVAYTTLATGNADIYVRAFLYGAPPTPVASGFLATLQGLTPGDRARPQNAPQVDSDGCRFAVAYVDRTNASDRDAYVACLDLAPGLRAIDPLVLLGTANRDTTDVGLVAKRSGGGSGLDYGTVWSVPASGIFANWIDGAIYRGVTFTGGISVRPTGCGSLSLSFPAGQVPAPGATIRFDLTHGGPTVFVLGLPTATPLCAPSSCTLGATPLVQVPAATLALAIPCEGSLVGGTMAVQGIAFGSGGCPSLGQLLTSLTADITVR